MWHVSEQRHAGQQLGVVGVTDPADEFLARIVSGDDVPEEYREVPEAGTAKPDPSEPWRYVCPDCGGQVNGDRKSSKYRCKRCGEGFLFEDLHDKKRFGEVNDS